MAQRKSPNTPSRGNKPGNRPAGSRQPASGAKQTRQPARKPKSIVNQKQTPWGLILTTVVIVLFAAGIVGVVVYEANKKSSSALKSVPGVSAADAAWAQPEIAAAKAITGLIYKAHPQHDHVTGTVTYDSSPPDGGNHAQYWAPCTGVVYSHQIANENAVHMLEHGAVWVTYNPQTIKAGDLAILTKDVSGVDYLALSPYAGLKTPISLQAWNYQLFVQSAGDSRVEAFINALRYNPQTTPEPAAGCADPGFDASKSTPGHPVD